MPVRLMCEIDERGVAVNGLVESDETGTTTTLGDLKLMAVVVSRQVVAPQAPDDDDAVRDALLAAIRTTRMQRMARWLPIVQCVAASLLVALAVVVSSGWGVACAAVIALVVAASWIVVALRELVVTRRFERGGS